MAETLTVTDTEFEASCGSLLSKLGAGTVERVNIITAGKLLAIVAVQPNAEAEIRAWLMRDMTFISSDIDLTEPILQDIPDAELGILHR